MCVCVCVYFCMWMCTCVCMNAEAGGKPQCQRQHTPCVWDEVSHWPTDHWVGWVWWLAGHRDLHLLPVGRRANMCHYTSLLCGCWVLNSDPCGFEAFSCPTYRLGLHFNAILVMTMPIIIKSSKNQDNDSNRKKPNQTDLKLSLLKLINTIYSYSYSDVINFRSERFCPFLELL